ncbi:DUF4199 domain-containing protein [Telluribacter sp.]|jgi:hypothetical protein|uniref:DUF4199 domain-containing protein n=1 Tax=Telluribacter sp. TaxID=1978767 RepID=UPI002E0EE609|nr:DUF4199 domain-containing protein [Telluribacter sp.]
MQRTVSTYGLVLGTILAAQMVYMVSLVYSNPDFVGNDLVGYAAMIIVFSLSFFGIRNYRDKQPGGTISFGRAFKMGALIALIGSTMYVVTWLFYYYLFVPDFMDKYTLHVLTTATEEGATAAELAAKQSEMDQYKELYKSPLMVILMTYAEVLPVGLVVALISALFLKKKPNLQTTPLN